MLLGIIFGDHFRSQFTKTTIGIIFLQVQSKML